MTIKVPVDRWSYYKLNQYAISFLSKAHPDGTIPIPIEDIIDLQYKIDILPMAGLDELGVVAFISRDMKTIYVDDVVYRHQNSNRYRFSIAHEFAHKLLHEKVFQAAQYTDAAGWKSFVDSIDEDCLSWIEYQARTLAGLLLVPSSSLEACYDEAAEMLAETGREIRSLGPDGMKQLARYLGGKFCVSHQVIDKRATKIGLWTSEAIMD